MSGVSRSWYSRSGRIYALILAFLLAFFMSSYLAAAAIAWSPLDDLSQGMSISPERAHERLEERSLGWPGEPREAASGPKAAGVQSGIRVSLPFDTVEGFTTSHNVAVRVELIRGVTVIQTVDTASNSYAWFFADLSAGDIQSGDRVKVTDLTGGDPVEVDCTLSGAASEAENRVSGTAPAGNEVDVYIAAPSTYYEDIPPGVAHSAAVAAGGAYDITFSDFDIRRGDVAYIFSSAGGNSVMDVANTGGSLVVYPQYDEVMGYYLPSTPLTVNAGSASLTTTTSKDGFLDAWFTDHDIVPGEAVYCDMGVSRSITVQDVSSACDPFNNKVWGYAPPDRPMRITMDVNGQAVVVETASDASGAYSVDLTGIYTVSGIEFYNVTWYNDAGDAVVYEFQTYSWFLPEGYTGQGFDEWVLVMNPTPNPAQVRVIFQTLSGPVEGPLFNAPPDSRNTIHVNEWTPNQHVSTMVTAVDGVSIMAERAMYMYGTIDGKWGAHDSIGLLTPSPAWYLPEGATYAGFDEWVLIQNPNDVPVEVKVQFLGKEGVAAEVQLSVGARSRYTVHANDYVPDSEISTRVECLTIDGGEVLPVFTERAMYMDTADGKRGSHDSIGISDPAPEWYLPEGTTRPGFDEWVLVMNPNDSGTTILATFLTPQGVGGLYEFNMAPNSRGTIHVNDFIIGDDVSTVVTSREGAGIMAERAMYIDTPDGKRGAHDSIGSYQTNTYWYLPEGTTRPGFDEWVLVQNPNGMEVEVKVTVLGPDGVANQSSLVMQPYTRHTFHVNDLAYNLDVSTVVESIGAGAPGVLAERAMYMWTWDLKQGAHDSIGIPSF
jgi:hypothetical protein